MISRDRLRDQVKGQLLSGDKFTLPCDITFMSHRWLRYTMTAKQIDAALVDLRRGSFFMMKFIQNCTSIRETHKTSPSICNVRQVHAMFCRRHF